MLTIFNRREPAVIMDMQKQSAIRNILASNGVKYLVRTRSSGGGSFGSRGRMESFGLEPALSCEYRIYVHKDDYAGVLSLIER